MNRIFLILFCLFSLVTKLQAQNCDSLGQNPETAFPICAEGVFYQQNVPICSTVNLFVPGCSTSSSTNYENKNPFWYKFTCFTTGPLGFTINPINATDDYDWQLYDITGYNPVDVYYNNSLVVTGNWSGSPGPTGASATGVNYIQCASDPSTQTTPTFAFTPTVIQGHNYLLLVSHYSNNQSGYSLSFNIGKENITDHTLPVMQEVNADQCNGKLIKVKFNKKIKCSSLTNSGNLEFEVLTMSGTVLPSPVIIQANGNGCNNNFELDSISLYLSDILPAGTYKLRIKKGADANTLLDNCLNEIPQGSIIGPFIVTTKTNPKFTHTIKFGCTTDTVSYFIVDTTAITNYNWTFDNGFANTPNPVVYYTTFGIKITTLEVTDKNNCKISFKDTFNLYNTLIAAFEATPFVCPNDKAIILNKSIGDSILKWEWDFGNGYTIIENPPQLHTQYYQDNPLTNYDATIQLTIENNLGCKSIATNTIKIVKNCYIAVPSAFSPNGDGLNDYLYPLNAFKAKDLKFSIYNRYGTKIFYTEDWTKKWDGKMGGKDSDAGTYVWALSYFDVDKNQSIQTKGSSILIR